MQTSASQSPGLISPTITYRAHRVGMIYDRVKNILSGWRLEERALLLALEKEEEKQRRLKRIEKVKKVWKKKMNAMNLRK